MNELDRHKKIKRLENMRDNTCGAAAVPVQSRIKASVPSAGCMADGDTQELALANILCAIEKGKRERRH